MAEPKYSWNIVIALILMAVVVAAEGRQSRPFQIKDGLFNFSQPATLGLDFAKGVESFDVFKATQDQNKYNHGAVLMPFKGMLFIQWQSSAVDEDASDTSVMYSISKDGENWGQVTSLVTAREHAVITNGGWWTDGNELISFINVWPKSLHPKEGYVEYIRSQDGKHWSKPLRLTLANGEYVTGIIEQDLRQLPSGRILTAMHAQPGLIATPYYTDDPLSLSGWTAGKMQNLPYQGQVSRELEPSWFVKKDGSIVMVFRDQASSFKVLASQSKDNGENWSMPVPTMMPDSRAKQSAGNLPDGSAFLVNNPSGTKSRIPLTITVSEDGNLFDRAMLLRAGDTDLPVQQYQGKYKRAGYSYPKSIIWDGFVYVSYAVNKEDIAVTRVPITSLYTVKTTQ